MTTHETISYVEFAAKDLSATKVFFQTTFGWKFEDYGPEYTAFHESGLAGGFYQASLCAQADKGSAPLFFTAMIWKRLCKRYLMEGEH